MSETTRSAAAALTGAILVGLASGAAAAPAPVREPARTPSGVPIRPAVATEDPADCCRLRKRLWIDGEGWVVRKVTICR